MPSPKAASIREVGVVTRQARNSFLGAVVICGFLALYLTNVPDRPLGSLRSTHAVFGPLLLWALTAAAYAFHVVVGAYGRLARRLDTLVTRDHKKAERLIGRIRSRLASSDRSMRQMIEQSRE